MIPVLTPEQSAAWDASAQSGGIAIEALMESAGRGAAAVITARLPDALRLGVLVAVGTGHNGGDGWVVARALHALGLSVWVTSVAGDRRPLTAAAAARALQSRVREVAPDGPWPGVGLVVDAVLGTGATGRPRDEVARLMGRLTDLEVPVVAIDGPTGLDLANGVSAGALQALMTITFGGYRRGHLLARDEVGDLVVVDIGLPPVPAEWPRLLTDLDAALHLVPFSSKSYKGTRGRVVVIGGDAGMVGAARLASRAAFAVGAGLVHLVAPPESIAALGEAEPDLQTLAHPFDGPIDGRLADLLTNANAVILGPGMGRRPGRTAWVAACAALGTAPLLIDADGLIALQGDAELLSRIAAARPVVITPHAGEFRALFPELANGSGVDPW
ncbi:MAG: NAD(P)H-hydrate epimerase, partial [Gemmatimonadota bacterium]